MLLNATCKAGRLQVDEGIIRVIAPFNKIVWHLPTSNVTKIVSQPSGIAYTVLIHTTQGTYTVEMVTKANVEKLQDLFPHLNNQSAGKATHWYEDITKRTHVETYTNQNHMQKDVEMAAYHGWMPQTSSGVGSHINVGRTVTAAALTSGFSLLLGASRSKAKTTMTFVRTPEWLAQNG